MIKINVWWVLLLFLIPCVLFGFFGGFHQGYLNDEMFTVRVLSGDFSLMLHDVHPFLYYFVQSSFSHPFLNYAMVFFCMCVLYYLTRSYFPVLAFGLSFVVLLQSNLMRMYILYLLIVVLWYWAARNKDLKCCVVISLLGLFSHYYLAMLSLFNVIYFVKLRGWKIVFRFAWIYIPVFVFLAWFVYFFQWFESKVSEFVLRDVVLWVGLLFVELFSGVHLETLYFWFGDLNTVDSLFGLLGLGLFLGFVVSVVLRSDFLDKLVVLLPFGLFFVASLFGFFDAQNFTTRYFIYLSFFIPLLAFKKKVFFWIWLWMLLNVFGIILNVLSIA